MLPIQGRPCELHLLLLCQTVTRAHGPPGLAQHPRRHSPHAKRGLAERRNQCFICLFEREHAGGQKWGMLWSNDGIFQRLVFYDAVVEMTLYPRPDRS